MTAVNSDQASAAQHPDPAGSAYSMRMLDGARVCVLITAASLPLSTAATNGFAVFAFAFWALSGQWRGAFHVIRDEPAAWVGCALFGALLAGITWSRVPIPEALGALLKHRGLVLFGIVMFLCSDERWRQRALWFFFASTIVLLALSFAIQLGMFEFVDARGFSSQKNAVLLKNHITHGFIMSLFAYGTAVVALRSAGWRRRALFALAALAAFNVWFSVQGRTGYVVMAVLVLWLAYSRRSVKGAVVAAIGLGVLLGAAYKWAPVFQERIDEATEEALDYRQMTHPGETSIGSRLHFWKRSAEWMTKHPLLGAGTGGWAEAFYEATEGDDSFMHNRERDHPHNEYVHMAVQLGPLGLALFIALLVVAFRRAALLADAYAELAQGFVIAFAVGCLFSDFMRDSTESHMWAVLGGALFSARPRQAA